MACATPLIRSKFALLARATPPALTHALMSMHSWCCGDVRDEGRGVQAASDPLSALLSPLVPHPSSLIVNAHHRVDVEEAPEPGGVALDHVDAAVAAGAAELVRLIPVVGVNGEATGGEILGIGH